MPYLFDSRPQVLHDTVASNIPRPTNQDGELAPLPPADLDDAPITPGNVNIAIDLDDMRKNHRPKSNKIMSADSLIKSERDIAMFKNWYKNYLRGRVSQENFGLVMSTSAASIVNVLAHVTTLYATRLKDLVTLSSFKITQSEVRYYIKSNYGTYMQLCHQFGYGDFRELDIDIPVGLKKPYREAINVITKYLNTINMLATSGKIARTLNNILTAVNQPTQAKVVSYINLARDIVPKEYDTLIKAEADLFDDKGNSIAKYGDMYGSNDLESLLDLSSAYENNFKSVGTVYKNLKDAERTTEFLIRNKAKLNPDRLNELAGIIHFYGTVFDDYANVIQDLTRVDHNMCLNIQFLRDKFLPHLKDFIDHNPAEKR